MSRSNFDRLYLLHIGKWTFGLSFQWAHYSTIHERNIRVLQLQFSLRPRKLREEYYKK